MTYETDLRKIAYFDGDEDKYMMFLATNESSGDIAVKVKVSTFLAAAEVVKGDMKEDIQ